MKNLILYVVGINPTTRKILNFDTDKIGDNLSTKSQLKVNQIDNINGISDLTIIYDEFTFNNMDLEMLADYIVNITPKYESGRNEDIIISTNYLYNKKNKNKFTINNLKVLDELLAEKISNINDEGKIYIDQHGDEYRSGDTNFDEDDDYLEDLVDILNIAASYDDREDVSFNISTNDIYQPIMGNILDNNIKPNNEVVDAGYNILNAVIGGNDLLYNYDDKEPITQDISDDYDINIRNYNLDDDDDWGHSFPPSKSLKKSVNTKHNIKKYNMIFVKNKKSVLKDYKIIKRFLKEFLPGNSKYMKEYRKEVAARWIFSLVRTYKQVKKLEKEQQEEEANANNKKFKKNIKKIAKAFMPILKS